MKKGFLVCLFMAVLFGSLGAQDKVDPKSVQKARDDGRQIFDNITLVDATFIITEVYDPESRQPEQRRWWVVKFDNGMTFLISERSEEDNEPQTTWWIGHKYTVYLDKWKVGLRSVVGWAVGLNDQE